MNNLTTSFSAFFLMVMATVGHAETLLSPDGQVSLNFELSSEGQPTYSLVYHGRDVVKPSHLGFLLRERSLYQLNKMTLDQWKKGTVSDFSKGFVPLKSETSTFDETWQTVWGEEAEIRNHYNQLTVLLEQQATKRQMQLEFRLFDDGLGFRYAFPEAGSLVYFTVVEELSEFAMNGDHKAW